MSKKLKKKIKYIVYFLSWVEHRVYFDQSRGSLLYLPKPKAEVNITGKRDFDQNKHDVQPKKQNIQYILSSFKLFWKKRNSLKQREVERTAG